MRSVEPDTKQPEGPQASTSAAVEPSAPPLPPSYDDVMSSVHSELATDPGTLSSDVREGMGPFGTNKPSNHVEASEHQPLMSVAAAPQQPATAERSADTLTSRDFFASLEYKRSSRGYSSSDPWLNSDARALQRFLVEGNERPRVSVEVEGTHSEERTVGERREEDGRVRTDTRRESVVDFRFSLELTPFVHERGTLHARDEPIEQVLEDYVKADSVLKEITVQKKVLWDYDLVRQLIVEAVKETGYPHTISVRFPIEGDRIAVRSSTLVGRVWRHPVTNFLCFVSCACAIGWPLRYLAAQRWRNKVTSSFVVVSSPADYVARHRDSIRDQVTWTMATLGTTVGSF
ncbi:hypothetical protein GGF46_000961 [Coemansia sp. RSA 552]|nr:hypothetical protein GGF46_000961 [Coemansia sp. RSA 552]